MLFSKLSSRQYLFCVFILAVVLRLGFTLAFRGSLDVVPERSIAGADSVEYDLFGRRVAEGYGYTWENGNPTAFRAPGYPLFLSAFYYFVSTAYPTAYCLMAICGGVCALATYFFAREIFGDRWGRCSGFLAAIYPPDIYACSYFFSEALFAPFLGFGLWMLARSVRNSSKTTLFFAGVLLGYAALIRSFAVLLLPIFAIYLYSIPFPRRFLSIAIYSIGFILVVAPWTLRNYTVFGKPVLIATNGGSTFYGANNDVVAGSVGNYGNWVATNHLPGRDLIDSMPDEVSHDKMEWKLGLQWVEKHPDKFAILAPFKVIRFWLPFVGYPSMKRYVVVNIASTAPFLALIVVGLVSTIGSRTARRQFAILHLIMAANAIMVVIFWGDPRFRDANVPVLMVYATVGLQKLLKIFFGMRQDESPLGDSR